MLRARWLLLATPTLCALGTVQVLAGPPAAPQARSGNGMDLRRADLTRRGGLPLTGPWEFYWKEFVTPGAAKATRPPTSQVTLPVRFSDLDSASLPGRGFGTYRLVLDLPADAPELALRVRSLYTAGRVYWNGRLIGQFGRPARTAEETVPQLRPLVVGPLPVRAGPNELLVHVANFDHPRGESGTYWLQAADLAFLERDQRRMIDAVLFGAIALIALYHFALFLARSEDRPAFWFSLFCAAIAVRLLATNERLVHFDGLPFWLQHRLEYVGWYLALPTFLLFLRALFPAEQVRYALGALLVAWVPFALTIALPRAGYSTYLQEAQILTILMGIYALVVVGRAVWHRRRGARLMLPGWLALFLAVLLDIYYPGQVTGGPQLVMPIGFLVFVFAQAGVLASIFAHTYHRERQLSIELERLNSVKDRFLANLSHELNTPLTTIVGYSEMLGESAEEEQSRRMAARIHQGATDLSEQLNDLFLLSRLESEAGNREHPLLDVVPLIRRAHESLAALAREGDVRIIEDVPGALSAPGSEKQIEKMLYNVLRNAVVYNRSGGQVQVTAAATPREVCITVEDTGVGIKADILPRIFDRFYRGDSSDTYAVGGVGLGLFVARSIAEAHGGSIEARSQPGQGTTVEIRLPREEERRLPSTG